MHLDVTDGDRRSRDATQIAVDAQPASRLRSNAQECREAAKKRVFEERIRNALSQFPVPNGPQTSSAGTKADALRIEALDPLEPTDPEPAVS